jgi:hypothetical protein
MRVRENYKPILEQREVVREVESLPQLTGLNAINHVLLGYEFSITIIIIIIIIIIAVS